jgi:hypothetical protein
MVVKLIRHVNTQNSICYYSVGNHYAVLDATTIRHLDTERCGLILSTVEMKLKLIYDRHSVGQSVLVSGAHLGPLTNFSFAIKFSVDSCGFVVL